MNNLNGLKRSYKCFKCICEEVIKQKIIIIIIKIGHACEKNSMNSIDSNYI